MIEYVIELLQDAVDFTWPAAKGSHFVLVHRIADGIASYSDLESVNKVRERFARGAQNQASTNQLKPVPCFKFNKNGCSETSDHPHQHLLLKHMCQHCFNTNKQVETHSKRNCPKLKNIQSKNV